MKLSVLTICALALLWIAVATTAWFSYEYASYGCEVQDRQTVGKQIAFQIQQQIGRSRKPNLEKILDAGGKQNKAIELMVFQYQSGSTPVATYGEATLDPALDDTSRQLGFKTKGSRGKSGILKIRFRPATNHAILVPVFAFLQKHTASIHLLAAVPATLCVFFCSLFLGSTRKKKSDSEEEVSHSQFAVDASIEAILICDKAGVIEFCNSAAETVFGQPNERLIGQNIGSFSWIHDLSLPGKHPWELTVDTGQRVGGWLGLENHHGKSFKLEVSSSAKTVDGKIVSVATTLLDVSQLSSPNGKSGSSSGSQSSFTSQSQTDLRSPINSILGYADILCHDRGVEMADRRRFFATIKKSCQKLVDHFDGKGIEQPPNSKTIGVDLANRFSELSRLNVLIADDCESTRELAGILLAKVGSKFKVAVDGKDALEKVANNQFDVILMDVHMPNMDGVQATRKLRSAGLTIPIIAWTAFVGSVKREACLESGFSGFLTKPFLRKDLYTEMLACLPAGNFDSISPIPQRATPSPALTMEALDKEDLQMVAGSFSESLNLKLPDMVNACSTGDLDQLREMGHWLIGSAPSAGFQELSDAGQTLHAAASSGSIDGCIKAVTTILGLTSQNKLEETRDGANA